ncbi:MAG TPA: Nramp family divalent metal transporter [Bryobacteraceae bacterium]|nr:Nramp family divalent metal transporter [Bryobacteraceae bacterium]
MSVHRVEGLNTASLPEVHASISTRHPSFWRRAFAFAGPAYLISVGYMDPGNWATDLEGGARFGFRLLWVIVLSNLMAILLQTLAARLGIVTSRDLAQACRESYPRPVSWTLWVFCEIAIAACDLAEVIGAAIGLQLLFHIPLLIGVLLTALDTLLILWFTNRGMRVIEAFVLALITVIAGCFLIEIWWARPDFAELGTGLIPRLSGGSLYVAIAIIGATVMPHNMYLHSALVQTRRIGENDADKKAACRFNLIDSVVALNGALLVNAAILILAATVFFTRHIVVTEIQQAYLLLKPLMGSAVASVVFAIALLCSGQSSTLTGTMAGQVVMEGFLNFRMRPWLRRLVTRMMAVIPAALTIVWAGDSGTYQLLILSQIILNLQLPFAVIPLIHFTSDKRRMGAFANGGWVRAAAWTCAALILGLDIWLAAQTISGWLSGPHRLVLEITLVPILGALLLLVFWILFEPVLPRRFGFASVQLPPEAAPASLPLLTYRRILVPLDHTPLDRVAIRHASALARAHHATLYLLHVEEDVTSQMYGPEASTAEVKAGQSYLDQIAEALENQEIATKSLVRYSNHPRDEIVRYAEELKPDLVVMGAHGHKAFKDIIFGTTINAVRHRISAPLLIVRQ